MADNRTLPLTGSGDATAAIRTVEKTSVHTQSVVVDVGGAGAESFLVRGQQTAANSLPVVIASDQSLGGGTQYTEDAAAAADPVGTMAMAVRADSLAAVTSADGDNIAARATNKGELYVKHADAVPVTDNGGSITVDGTVTANAGTGPFPVSDNAGSLTVDAPVGTPVFARLSDGAAALTTASGRLAVDPSGVTSPVSIAAAVTVTQSTASSLNAQVVGAAASGAAKAGNPVQSGAVFNTTQPTVTTGQAVENQATARGGLIVATGADTFNVTVNAALPTGSNVIGALSANQSVNVAQVNGVATSTGNGVSGTGVQRVTIASDSTGQVTLASGATAAVTQATASNLNAQVVGSVASDSGDSGNPVKVGGRARTTEITAVADNDRVDFIADAVGKQITLPYAIPEKFTYGSVSAAMTGTTDAAVIAAPGANLRLYITQITITNDHATVGTVVNIKDGTTTMYKVFAAAAGGGATITLPVPLRLTANTALNAANVTTGSSVYVSASGYIAP